MLIKTKLVPKRNAVFHSIKEMVEKKTKIINQPNDQYLSVVIAIISITYLMQILLRC